VLLGIQPNLANPDITADSALLRQGLPAGGDQHAAFALRAAARVRSIAKVPELVLVSSLGWCFFVCAGAAWFGLSLEMGALIAGVAISTFPYNLDVIAKVVSIRDFFVTLFFVSLGMQIPDPRVNPLCCLWRSASRRSWCFAIPLHLSGAVCAQERHPCEPAHLNQSGAAERILAGHRLAGLGREAYQPGYVHRHHIRLPDDIGALHVHHQVQ
jgi:hypothetical protein